MASRALLAVLAILFIASAAGETVPKGTCPLPDSEAKAVKIGDVERVCVRLGERAEIEVQILRRSIDCCTRRPEPGRSVDAARCCVWSKQILSLLVSVKDGGPPPVLDQSVCTVQHRTAFAQGVPSQCACCLQACQSVLHYPYLSNWVCASDVAT